MPRPKTPPDFDAMLAQLLATLEELRALLRDHDRNGGWDRLIETSRREISRFDTGGLDRLLAAYGGMGSFNDLVLGPADGGVFTAAEIDVNRRLSKLRSECWYLAKALRQQLPA